MRWSSIGSRSKEDLMLIPMCVREKLQAFAKGGIERRAREGIASIMYSETLVLCRDNDRTCISWDDYTDKHTGFTYLD
jgi:hypothetical protein